MALSANVSNTLACHSHSLFAAFFSSSFDRAHKNIYTCLCFVLLLLLSPFNLTVWIMDLCIHGKTYLLPLHREYWFQIGAHAWLSVFVGVVVGFYARIYTLYITIIHMRWLLLNNRPSLLCSQTAL